MSNDDWDKNADGSFFRDLMNTDSMKQRVTKLDAEIVQCYLYALSDEARRRGSMFPQTSDEQDKDRAAIRRVCGMVEWYGERGYPLPEKIAELFNKRSRNRHMHDEEQADDGY